MSLPADYHMHTPLCRHAVGEPMEYAAQALRAGLTEIGFSDHSPMPQDDFDDWRMPLSQLDRYVGMVREVQRSFPNLTVKLALEVDYIPGHEAWIKDLASRYPWDYLIGSVHYVSDSWDLDNPKKLSLWQERDPFETWTIYFERLAQAAASGLFEIIGHADLAKKFCFYPKQDCTHLFAQFLKAARQTDTAIELNTAGLRKDCKEIYPSLKILQMARDEGVEITFGSDAHAPSEVGMDFIQALDLARSAGFAHRRVLTERTVDKVPL